jgi:hypothetical protein
MIKAAGKTPDNAKIKEELADLEKLCTKTRPTLACIEGALSV